MEFRNPEGKFLYIGIAKNNAGFCELNVFFTSHSLAETLLPEKAPAFNDVYRGSTALNLAKLKDNEFIGIAQYGLPKLHSSELREYTENWLCSIPSPFKT
jgi:hypothetical protein